LIPVQFDGAIILRADLDRETKMRMMREMTEYAIAHLDEAQAQAREYMRKMGLSATA
jgi:predicted solute-binding protein